MATSMPIDKRHSFPRRCHVVPLVVICLYALATGVEAKSPYLAASDKGKVCSEGADIVGLNSDPDIKKAVVVLGLQQETITYVGCEGGVFSTTEVDDGNSTSFKISYPLPDDAIARAPKPRGKTPYLAPVTHELAHVLQLKQKGGYRSLTKDRTILSVELGADFVAGLALARIEKLDPSVINAYQQNLALGGKYNEDEKEAHGSWAQRTYAFRRGVFIKENVALSAADSVFESEIYLDIVELHPAYIAQNVEKDIVISLDKMSSCDEVAKLKRILEKTDVPITECRPPSRDIEFAYRKAYRSYYKLTPCLLNNNPTSMLQGFSCFQPSRDTTVMTCFRPADPRVVVQHRANQYMAQESSYLQAASVCDGAVDSAIAEPGGFPFSMATFSKFEFGYRRTVGKGSIIQHGYATINPALKVVGSGVVEYIDIFVRGKLYSTEDVEKKIYVGDWEVLMGRNLEAEEVMRSAIQPAGLNISLHFTTLELKRRFGARVIELSKLEFRNSLMAEILEFLSDEEFKRAGGSNRNEQKLTSSLADLESRMPYGMFHGFNVLKQKPSLAILTKESGHPCTKNSGGAFAVTLIFTPPVSNAASDQGSMLVMLLGGGQCGTQALGPRRYLNRVSAQITELVKQHLEAIK